MYSRGILRWAGPAVLALCAGHAADAQVPPPAAASRQVEIAFSERLARSLPAIDRIERVREERFRASRIDTTADLRSVFRHAATRTTGAQWAGERLIPELEQYSIEALLRALVETNLDRAVPGFEGKLTLEIERIKIVGHSLALLRGPSSYAVGRIALADADGRLLFEDRVQASLVVRPTLDLDHDGPEFAFAETDESDRAGPTLSQFVEKALERAWPDRKAEIHGPVIVRLSGPNEFLADTPRKLLDNPAVMVGDRIDGQFPPR